MSTKRGPKPETVARARALRVSVADLFKMRQRISCAIANLGEFRLYFSRKHKCVIARSTHVRRHFRLPRGALLVGTYGDAIKAHDIIADIEELLARSPDADPADEITAPADECEEAPPAAQAGAGEAIEAAEALPHVQEAIAAPGPRRRPRTHSWNAYFRASKPAS